MAPTNPIWDLFLEDTIQLEDGTTKPKRYMNLNTHNDTIAVAQGEAVPVHRSEKEWLEAAKASKRVEVISSKTNKMRSHARNCPAIAESLQKMLEGDDIVAHSDAATTAPRLPVSYIPSSLSAF
ncbi:hypothetical protein FB451DRAFT_1565365 [Mycena latifolia]|nr:hypothetical protein FB451DRAFT_1565365 [Mycena latifolia]